MRDLQGWAKARHAAKKTLKWVAIGTVVAVVAGVSAIYIAYRMTSIPDPNKDFQAQTSTVYYSDGKHVIGHFAVQNRYSIPLSEVPKSMQEAVVAAEDRSFYTNGGVDLRGIIRAAWNNLRSDSTQGGSTITQQYVKVLYLSQERTWKRKIKEALLAVKLQNTESKDQILEGYLNTIYFGRGAYGVQAAAQAYFAKDARALTIRQSAALASILNSPGNLDPALSKANRAALLDRYHYVLDGMAKAGDITRAQATTLGQRLPKFPKIKTINVFGGQRGYLLTLVKQQLLALGFTDEDIEGGGLSVVTTFSYKDMQAAKRAVRTVRPAGKKQLHVALASVDPRNGAVKAMIGGRNYLTSNYNWATHDVSPGSTFKAFALAAALRSGITLDDTFDGNSPLVLPDGTQIQNEGEASGIVDGQDYGTVTLRTATEDSINTAYVDMTEHMKNGPQKILDAAVDAGIPRNSPGLDPNPVIALGSASVSPLAMADAYSTFAAEGLHSPWFVVERVSDANGQRYEHGTVRTREFRPAISNNVTAGLEAVVKAGTGVRALALNRPAAGKTGTATHSSCATCEQHVSSSWFVGYTPQLATAVAYSRGNGTGALDGYLDTYFGADYPTETWTAYMRAALRGLPVVGFPAAANLRSQPTTFVPSTTFAPPTTTAPTTTAPTTTRLTTRPPTTTAPTTTEPPTTTGTVTTTGPTTTAPTTPTTATTSTALDRQRPSIPPPG